MDKLSWLFELQDKFSGPAGKMAASLDKFEVGTKKVGPQFDKMSNDVGGAMDRMGGSVGGGVSRMLSGLAAVGAAAAATAAVAGGLAAAGGKWMLDSLAFRETTITSLEAILKSKSAAEDVFKQATKFAAKTPYSTKDVASAFEQLVASGFKVGELDKAMTSIGDFAGTDVSKLQGAINVLGQIRSKGKLATEELQQLAERGLPMQTVIDGLAKSLGKTGDQVRKMLEAGQISSQQGIAAVMAAMDQTFGGRMEKSANTLEGLISTIKSIPEDLLFSVDMSGVIGPIRELLKRVVSFFSPDSTGGQAVQAFFTKVAQIVGDLAKRVLAFDFAGWFEKVSAFARIAWGYLQQFWDGFSSGFDVKEVLSTIAKVIGLVVERFKSIDPRVFKALGTIIGVTATLLVGLWAVMTAVAVGVNYLIEGMLRPFLDLYDGIVWVVENIGGLWGMLEAQIKSAWDALDFSNLGTSILLGIAQGLIGGGTGGMMAMLGDLLIAEFKAKMGIASPSKESESWGVAIGEGLVAGIVSMAGRVAQALTDLVKPPGMSIPGIGEPKSSLIAPAPPGAPSGAGFSDTGPLGGLFGGFGKFASPAQPASMPPAQPGTFERVLAPFNIGAPKVPAPVANSMMPVPAAAPAPSPNPNTPENAIPPSVPRGDAKPAELAGGGREIRIDMAGANYVFQISNAENGEQVAKEAAGSIADQLGAALKGLAGEMGG